jgi:hypothetical protein
MMKRLAGYTLAAVSAFAVLALGCESASSEPKKPMVMKRAIDPKGPREVAILAGGCFWGMEHVMRDAPGVVSIEVGYAGGKSPSASYAQVSSGSTGHAESCGSCSTQTRSRTRTYCSTGTSAATIRRSSIARTTTSAPSTARRSSRPPTRNKTAEAVKARVDKNGKWKKPIVTRIETGDDLGARRGLSPGLPWSESNSYNDHFVRSSTSMVRWRELDRRAACGDRADRGVEAVRRDALIDEVPLHGVGAALREIVLLGGAGMARDDDPDRRARAHLVDERRQRGLRDRDDPRAARLESHRGGERFGERGGNLVGATVGVFEAVLGLGFVRARVVVRR